MYNFGLSECSRVKFSDLCLFYDTGQAGETPPTTERPDID